MNTVRRGTWETNSSSTHSITICTEDEFDRWAKRELYFNSYQDKLFTPQEVHDNWQKYLKDYNHSETGVTFEEFRKDAGYKTYEEWEDNYWLETYVERYTTPGGEKIIAFGEFGYDG